MKGKKSDRLKTAALGIHQPEPTEDVLPPADPWLLSPRDARHASDVHVYLPRMTKTGTLFRPSARTIARRAAEFNGFLHALLADDVPPALRRIRGDRVVHDFFGYWRRDHDVAQRTGVIQEVEVDGLPSLVSPTSTISRSSMFTGTPSMTSGSSDAGHSSSPSSPARPRWEPSSPIPSALGTQGLMSSIASWRTSAEGSPEKARRLQELSDLVVHIDTVEEEFEDRRNTLKQEDVDANTRSALRQDEDDTEDERRNTLRPEDVEEGRRDTLRQGAVEPIVYASSLASASSSSSCLSPTYDSPQPESRASTDSRPSVSHSLASSHASQSSSSYRSRPLPKPPGARSRAQEILGVQPVPTVITPDARIVLHPNTDLPSVSHSKPPAAVSLPAPPRSTRRRVDSEASVSPPAPRLHRAESSGTFGGGADDADDDDDDGRSSSHDLGVRRDSLMSMGTSVFSDSVTSAFAADIHRGVVRLSAVAPRVVWVPSQNSPRSPSFPPAVAGRQDAAPSQELSPLGHRAASPSLSVVPPAQLESLLEMDVSQRWWRNSDSTVTKSPLMDYPPDEVFDEDSSDSGDTETGVSSSPPSRSSPEPLFAPSVLAPPLRLTPSPSPSPSHVPIPYSAPASVSAAYPYPRAPTSHASSSSSRRPSFSPGPVSPEPAPYARSVDRKSRPGSGRVQDWATQVPSRPTSAAHHTVNILGALAPQPRRNRDSWQSGSRPDPIRF
jgi:hypothetical protein